MPQNIELQERVDRWLKGQMKSADLYEISPQLYRSLAEYGCLLYEQGKYETAKVIFEALATIDSSDSNVQKFLGSIYQIQKKWDAAYYRYSQSLKISPNDLFVIVNRGESLIHAQRPREAAEDFKRAIQLDPQGNHPAGRRARVLLANLSSVQRWAPK
jgi:Tfp pilus assembly protein PilF